MHISAGGVVNAVVSCVIMLGNITFRTSAYCAPSGRNGYQCVHVRKGSKLYVEFMTISSDRAIFFPLVY